MNNKKKVWDVVQPRNKREKGKALLDHAFLGLQMALAEPVYIRQVGWYSQNVEVKVN